MLIELCVLAMSSSVLISIVKRVSHLPSYFSKLASVLLPLLLGLALACVDSYSGVDLLLISFLCWLVSAGFYDRISRWLRPVVELEVGRGNASRAVQNVDGPPQISSTTLTSL